LKKYEVTVDIYVDANDAEEAEKEVHGFFAEAGPDEWEYELTGVQRSPFHEDVISE
jgi:hypothetical protein